MAFKLPGHLARGGTPQDEPARVLTKVGEATPKTLNASLAASWLAELDFTIQETKSRISRRIHDDFPAFERHFQASSSVQTRLTQLTGSVDCLVDSLNNTETGILPTLLQALTAHSTLSSQANDSEITHRTMTHLCRIQEEIQELSRLVMNGELPESAGVSVVVQALITEAPSPLNRAIVMGEIQKRHRTLDDCLQEQLSDAYDRSIKLQCTGDNTTLTILSSTIAIPTPTRLTLSSILQSLSADSLSSRLSRLRRNVITKIVEPLLSYSGSIVISTSESFFELKLSLHSPSPTPLKALQTIKDFLTNHLFPHLPPSQENFATTFHVPLTNAILTHLLQPYIPTSLAILPSFLNTVEAAVQFEEDLVSSQSNIRTIRHWASDVATHYERRRREAFIQKARLLISSAEDGLIFRVEIDITQSSTLAQNSSENDEMPSKEEKGSTIMRRSLHSGIPASPFDILHEESPEDEETGDAWGWGDDDDDDDIGPSPEAEQPKKALKPDVNPIVSSEISSEKDIQEEEAEDDPWDDDGWSVDPDSPQKIEPERQPEEVPLHHPAAAHTPKTATRLEKFSAKTKGSAFSSLIHSPAVPNKNQPPPPSPLKAQAVSKLAVIPNAKEKRQERKQEKKQSYVVSVRARKVLEIAAEVLREGHDLLHSSVLADYPLGKAAIPGQLLLMVAPLVLDLHRALYPIAHSSSLARDTNLAMRWSNDCTFLSNEIESLKHLNGSVDDRWTDTADRLRRLSEIIFEGAIATQQETVRNILIGAGGFMDISNSERWQECSGAVSQVLQGITNISCQWKETLTRDSYFRAVGVVVDEALFRIMDDILSLQDIPEKDSERLSDLCESLTPLEELFVYTPGEQSVAGTHVPLWFKFSYLSWLIKGSIADISYLFDQGTLVDYEIDELIRLLRALFVETPLRESTITKFSQGHPVTLNYDQ